MDVPPDDRTDPIWPRWTHVTSPMPALRRVRPPQLKASRPALAAGAAAGALALAGLALVLPAGSASSLTGQKGPDYTKHTASGLVAVPGPGVTRTAPAILLPGSVVPGPVITRTGPGSVSVFTRAGPAVPGPGTTATATAPGQDTTMTAPGQDTTTTATATETMPGPTETMPGPTETVTATATETVPGPTETVTATATETVTRPAETVTQTVPGSAPSG